MLFIVNKQIWVKNILYTKESSTEKTHFVYNYAMKLFSKSALIILHSQLFAQNSPNVHDLLFHGLQRFHYSDFVLPMKETPPLDKTLFLDKIVNDALSFWKIPGCAVSVVHGDEIVLCKGYGIRQIDSLLPDNSINIHTRFPIASLSKLFTSVAFSILLDKGELTLDTPVIDFYPSLKLSDEYATTHLTFRDCLSMRSGLPGPSVNDRLYSNSDITQEELLENILPSLPFPLGFRSHFAYQNLLYLLAATPFSPSYETFLQKSS